MTRAEENASALQNAVERIGERGTVRSRKEGWGVPVTVLDVRQAYGRIDYLCRPDCGGKDAWVTEARLTFDGE